MPSKQQKSKSKKKVKRQDRSEKLLSCEGCSTVLDKKIFQYCICTSVRFCSLDCLQDRPHKDCPGPPETRIDLNERLKHYREQNEKSNFKSDREGQEKEMLETVQKPSSAYLLQKRMSTGTMGVSTNSLDVTAWDYAGMADEGDALANQACAYLAGVRFKHRILGAPSARRRGGLVAYNSAADNINLPVLESQEIAFKYFEKAAKLGHGLAMQSFGECFDEGIGCRKNRRRCNQWLWRSCLHNSCGAIDLLNSRALLPLEINATSQMVDQTSHMLQPGQSSGLGGPNLGSLLLAFHQTVEKEKYSLPPFAGTWASATVNNTPVSRCDDKPRIPLIASEAVKEVMKKVKFLRSRGNDVIFSYGRRGAAKAATAQTRGQVSRPIDNQLFAVPPNAACDERVSEKECRRWQEHVTMLQFRDYEKILFPFCVHTEQKGQRNGAAYCRECEVEAMERLDAVSNGGVVLSIDEELPHHGQAAIYRSKSNGSLKVETWKTYAGGEAECVLAIIAASGISPYVAPLFIAQDPNFYWPLIADHGSIRAALEFVAPHIDWNEKVGAAKDKVVDQTPVLKGSRPGSCLVKCGNSFCTNLEDYKARNILLCEKCQRRRYCSAQCQSADWTIHKLECKVNAKSSAKALDPHVDVPDDGNNEEDGKVLTSKYDFIVCQGDNAIVHGLKSKPEYNGRLGIVGESKENGRLSLSLKPQTGTDSPATPSVLSIKSDNLYCIGVFCRKRRKNKKSMVFECVHGKQVCPKCYFDFKTVNRLAKLKHAGQDMTSSFAIDQVNETYLSSFKMEEEDQTFECKDGFPLQCYGMEQHLKQRYILKALLEVETSETVEISVPAMIAKTAFITFGASKYLALRAFTNLESVAQVL